MSAELTRAIPDKIPTQILNESQTVEVASVFKKIHILVKHALCIVHICTVPKR